MPVQKLDVTEWRQLFELLDAVLDLPQTSRAAWIDALGPEHERLRAPLRELLARQVDSDFLQGLPAYTQGAGTPVTESQTLHAGDQIGPYQLLRELGQGGMASVWLAERTDGAYQRQVALKLPHASWTGGLAERLVRERAILAGLTHPNIARLYDAGADQLGRPYMAMEYVEGLPIDQYCARNGLSLRQRVALVAEVARAVAYAHSRLVVHRDLKPGNILVSADGAVHLLDFGIAKLLEGETLSETRLTQVAGRPLTPDYAAPEQIRGEPVGTATDVYSLAVITYALLSGERPYRLRRQGAADLERSILDVDPPLASDAASEPTRRRELRGDLDAILNKAMKKDPAARYTTADAFAADLQRYLTNETVLARPDSFTYRSARFLRRHRLVVAAGSTIAIALLVASGVSLWQARVAAEQRARALALLDRSEAVTEFVNQMLTELATSDQPITLEALLARSESLVSSAATENPEHQAVILQALAAYYVSFSSPAKGETLLQRAIALTANSTDVSLRAKLACEYEFARSLQSDVEIARQAINQVLADKELPADAAATCLRHLAYIAQNTNDAGNALHFAQQAQTALRRWERADPLFEAGLLGDLGYAYAMSGNAVEAERFYAQSIASFEAMGRPEHAIANTIRNNWGMASGAAGDVQGALAQYDEALSVARKHAAGGDVPSYLLSNRAMQLDNAGRYDEALEDYGSAIEIAQRAGSINSVVAAQLGRARVLLSQGDLEAAAQAVQGTAALFDQGVPRDGPPGMNAQLLQARITALRGNPAAAEQQYNRIAQFWEDRQMGSAGPMVIVLRWRAEAQLQRGNTQAALDDALRALDIGLKLRGSKPFSSLTGLSQLLLSRIYAARGQLEQADAAAREAEDQLSHALGPQSPDTQAAQAMVAASASRGHAAPAN